MGWSGGAVVLGELPGPGRPTSLDKSRARAYCTCSRCGWGCLDIFTLVYPFSFLSPSLWETTRYRLKYCLKGSLSPKTTNQPTHFLIDWHRQFSSRRMTKPSLELTLYGDFLHHYRAALTTRPRRFSGPEIIKKFSCSNQLSMKFFLLKNVKMPITYYLWAF